ncbi:NAD(P)/FAD-dependent oxidoreductase [Niveibacterium umoris]
MSSRESGFPATGWIGADPTIGHRLRTAPPDSQEAAERLATDVLIVGGGIGGLSAGWWLERAGLGDFLVAEIQPTAGGNARGGGNEISRFPLGAHYLPLPTRESFTLRRLLADLGALKGDPDGLRPRYEERLLCAAPQERLLRHGHWQEGVIPDAGLSKSEREEFSHFFALVGGYRNRSGTRKAFALPMACSRLDDEMRHLDTKTFGDWLRENGLTCAPLRWYVDYACRDDFGTPADAVSAWAGLHYFASRDGMAEGAANDVVLTAPEGNAWITEGLAQRLGPRVRCGWMVRRLTRTRSGFEASIDDVGSGRSIVCAAKAVIWAAPLFIAARVIEQLPDLARAHATQIDYAPWVMAQLTLESAPPERPGAERAWDNVVYGARSLGYVVATHQRLSAAQAPTVWTWYHALTGAPSPILRQQLLASTPEYWARFAIEELAPAYPELLPHVQRIDCIRHGHAMARPRPGFLTAPARHWFAQGVAGLQFAHADVSGFSVCEEAHARGVAAAERIAARLRGRMPDPSVIYSV